MKKLIFTLIILLLFGLTNSCNSKTKRGSYTSFELSSEGNTFYRLLEMEGISSDGEKYGLNVVYGYTIINETKDGTDQNQVTMLNSFTSEMIADYIALKLKSKPINLITELKKLNSFLEQDIIENLYELNNVIEDQGIEIIKLDITMRN